MTASLTLKPEHVFDREVEWHSLTSFATAPGSGATLGVVSGRRRQGKSYLLAALTRELGGLYFPAIEATEAESLRLFGDALVRFTRRPLSAPFRDWNDAIGALFGAAQLITPVVIDEFPFLVNASPSLPSIVQRELGPTGSGEESGARLLLCGSAMSVMGQLLAGGAPLRGRASLELVLRPFGYREAARFWGINDPELAVLVYSVVGGTPAYRREFVADDAPVSRADFDSWVVRTALNRQSPLFREARYLLAEETSIRDPALYQSVLAAVAMGNSTSGGIASFIGRRSDQIAHPLNVLEDSGLLERAAEPFRPGRFSYRITEPLISFYQAIMRARWSELERGRASQVWRATQSTFMSRVVGPQFEALCREFAIGADADVFGELPAEVGSGVINDAAHRTQIEVDVAVLGPAEPGIRRHVLSLGEAEWGRVMGVATADRLARARDLLAVKGYDCSRTVIACYSGVGFDDELRSMQSDHVVLIDLNRLYGI